MSKLILSAALAAITLITCSTPAVLSQGMSKDQTATATYKGIEAIKARQFSTAIAEFTKLANSEPSNGEYLALRGSAYYDSRDYSKAKTDFANAIKKGYNKHLIYEQLNNAESRLIMAGMTFGNGTVGEMVEKATAALKSGDSARAIGTATILIDDVKLPTKVHQGGYILRAEAFLKMGRKQNAKVDAETVINSGVDVPQTRDLLKRATE